MKNPSTYLRSLKAGYAELQQVKHDPQALAAFLGRASQQGASTDLQAMIVLAMHRHADEPVILRALSTVARADPHPRVRSAVATALGEMTNEQARALLDQMATEDPDAGVRSNARYSLERLANGTLPITARN